MNILVFTTLYPNAAQPNHGVFVENRLRHFLAASGHRATVIAPVPWVPPGLRCHRKYRRFDNVPSREVRHGIEVWHPRYGAIPKIGMTVAPALLYLAGRRQALKLIGAGERFDLIDAQYFYPDGVAAALLARTLELPFTVTGRGSDLALLPRYAAPRTMIRWAAERAQGVITVSEGLRQELVRLGVARERVRVLRNGVDLESFRRDRRARMAWREKLGTQGPVIASVGNLIPLKGHDLVVRTLPHLSPETTLLIVGIGPDEGKLRTLATELGLAGRVHFMGAVPHELLFGIYSAADALVLASSREGWPNVLLESMACGTPVVATAVTGAPEIVRDPVAGRIVSERTPTALATSIDRLLAEAIDPDSVRAYAEGFSWDATSRGLIEVYERAFAGMEVTPGCAAA